MNINEHITNFFAITGRHISTLTVEEYIQFQSLDTNLDHVNINMPNSAAAHENTPILAKSDVIKPNNNHIVNMPTAKEKANDNIPAVPYIDTDNTVNSNSSILALMKSVKG